MLGLLACSNNSKSVGPVETVNRFFRCMDHHDVNCMWTMSGPKTRKIFIDLSEKLSRAHDLVYNRIPVEHRKRYVDALLLNKFTDRVTPLNCLAIFLNIKELRSPSIPKENMVVGKSGKNTTVYLPGNTTVLLIPERGRLKLEVLGNTLLKLAFYRTLLHNLDVLDHDAGLFKQPLSKK